MPGLDPGIHPSSQDSCEERWIAGSSPAMTPQRSTTPHIKQNSKDHHHGQSSRALLLRLRSHRSDGECHSRRRPQRRRHRRRQARAGAGAGSRRQGFALQARSGSPGRQGRRPRQLRRHHRRHRHPLRPDGFADGELPRPGRRPLGQGRAARQGRRRLHRDPRPSTADRKPRCSLLSPTCCTSA